MTGYINHWKNKKNMNKLKDNSSMPWGKFKGTQMSDVPDDYLVYMYNANKCDNQVKIYIEENLYDKIKINNKK